MNKYIILGHENPDVDSIISGYLFEKILNSSGYLAEFVIPDRKISEDSLNICLDFNLDPTKFQRDLTEDDKKFILVDHHERNVKGEVVAIIDHHPTKGNENIEKKVKYYKNEQLSSTTCFIKNLSITNCLTKTDWELVILAAMVDTASFHSTKSVKDDYEWIKSICEKYQIDYERLYDAGLCLTGLENLEEAKLTGLKKYSYQNKKIECSYIQIRDVSKEQEKILTILNSLTNYRIENDLDYFVFIVHNMDNFKSRVYNITENGIELIDYPNYTSRGNKIIPDVYKKIDMDNKPNIFIASSSREEINPIYLECASSISKILANLGYSLSFGASNTGMMGRCYEEFNKSKSKIYSYTVEKYQEDLNFLNSTKEIILDTTFERTKELYTKADIILFLPGGTGTLSELFSTLEENRSISNPKKIILYNYDGFYNKVLDIISYLISEKFNDDTIYNYFHVCNNETEVIASLSSANNIFLKKSRNINR